MSVAQIATGSALSTSVTQLFDNSKVGPKNNNHNNSHERQPQIQRNDKRLIKQNGKIKLTECSMSLQIVKQKNVKHLQRKKRILRKQKRKKSVNSLLSNWAEKSHNMHTYLRFQWWINRDFAGESFDSARGVLSKHFGNNC